MQVYNIAREHRAPAKDPPNSHTPPYKHTHTQHTSIHTSIHTKQNRHKPQSIHRKQSRRPSPNSTPKNRTVKKSITLYNSKYCIRVVLCRKIDDILGSKLLYHLFINSPFFAIWELFLKFFIYLLFLSVIFLSYCLSFFIRLWWVEKVFIKIFK